MAEQRESSILFSLKGLMDIEQKRIEDEADARRRASDAAFAAQAELERQKLEAEQRAEREAEAARQLEGLRERETAARLEALRISAVERARVEAESHARVELIEKQQEHERRMAALREESRRRRDVHVARLSMLIAVAAIASSLGLYFGKLRPETQRLARAYHDLASAERDRAEAARVLLDRSERQRREAVDELGKARSEIERLSRSDAPKPKPVAGAPLPTPAKPDAPRSCKDTGDPMDGCL